LRVNSANEENRFHALLAIVPFDHGEYFAVDSALTFLYQTDISPAKDLQGYATTLAEVIQGFAFDRPRRSVCVYFNDDKKKPIENYCTDFYNLN
jgi:hypothetical protein